MDTYVQELISTIEALTDSKQKLQTYMLEQVTLFKSKLQRAEDDNKHLRLALAASKPGTAASPPRTGFRDASLAARVSAATSDAAALRVSSKDMSHVHWNPNSRCIIVLLGSAMQMYACVQH